MKADKQFNRKVDRQIDKTADKRGEIGRQTSKQTELQQARMRNDNEVFGQTDKQEFRNAM
jgi:hypothetical protein